MSWPEAFAFSTVVLCLTTIWGLRVFGRALRGIAAEAQTVDNAKPTAPKPAPAPARKDTSS